MNYLFFLGLVLSTKVTISPVTDRLIALSYTRNDAHSSIFNFISKSRITQTARTCMIPMVVPLKNGRHRFYFCEFLMCLSKKGLNVCEKPNEESEFDLISQDDMFLIGKNGFCLHVNEGNIFLRECDVDSQEQLFYIDRVSIPNSDNADVAPSLREQGRGNRLLLADSAYRDLSRIKNFEYIRELFDNEMKFEIIFSNENKN